MTEDDKAREALVVARAVVVAMAEQYGAWLAEGGSLSDAIAFVFEQGQALNCARAALGEPTDGE